MKITVIGAGNMGSAFVKQLTRAGHDVSVTARDSAKAAKAAADNPKAKAVAAGGAAQGADAIVLATGYADAVAALRSVGDVEGKVVIDITNPLTADYMGLTIGHETSAAALTWALYLLAQHPSIADEIRAEVSALGVERVGMADLARLPRLGQVVSETLRLYPPAYVITRSTRAAMTLGGRALKVGDKLFLNTYGVQRRPDLFPDPERFSPERFLDGAERSWPRGAYAPFGAGPRICVGNHFAMMEGQLVLARLAQRLVLEQCVDQLPDPRPLITLRPKQRLSMRIVPRHG